MAKVKLDAWELAMLEKLVEKEILAQPNAGRIAGRVCAPGQYGASLDALLKKLGEAAK